jgi:hypothetical protein
MSKKKKEIRLQLLFEAPRGALDGFPEGVRLSIDAPVHPRTILKTVPLPGQLLGIVAQSLSTARLEMGPPTPPATKKRKKRPTKKTKPAPTPKSASPFQV